MSEFLQSGHHPDADQLNAFVEHALPPHEQQQTLAHLAVCTECRAIVSLSLPQGDEVFLPQAQPVRRPGFSGWNLAWPVAVAFALLVPILLHVRKTARAHDGGARTEMALSHTPESISPPAVAPALAANAPAAEPARAKGTSPRVAKGPEVGAPPARATAPVQSSNSVSVASDFSANGPRTASGGMRAGVSGSAGISAPPSAQAGMMAGRVAQQAAAPTSPPALPSSVAVDAAAASTLNQTIAATHADGQPLSDSSFVSRALKAVAPSPLPSGLPTLSTASNGHESLALDTRNALFYSNDDGRHWKAIAAQWKGRAVKVDLANTVGLPQARGPAPGAAADSINAASFYAPAGEAPRTGSSSVGGKLTDPSGAAIPNAAVIVSDASKVQVGRVKTDPNGFYLIKDLAPGNYEIEAAAPGFQKLQLEVTLTASEERLADLTLQVGSVSETVTVEAESRVEPIPSPAAKKTATPAAPIRPAALFKITTETGDRWTSYDGQTWTHP